MVQLQGDRIIHEYFCSNSHPKSYPKLHTTGVYCVTNYLGHVWVPVVQSYSTNSPTPTPLNKWKYLNERYHKIYTASQTIGGQVNFCFPTWKVVPVAYSDQRGTLGHTWNTPKKVLLCHFHERVGESPRREKNFGTSGSKIPRSVSEIWPFEVGICVRAD